MHFNINKEQTAMSYLDEQRICQTPRTALETIKQEFLTHEEVADLLGVDQEMLTTLVNNRQIRCCTVPGGSVLFFVTDIRNYLFHLRSNSDVDYVSMGEPHPL